MRISDWSSDVCSSDLLASVNAAFRAVSVAGSMPVRPRVRDIVSIRFLAAPKCCQARGARQRAYCGKLLPPRAVAAAPEAETRRGSEKTGTQCPRRIPVRPVAGQPGRRLRLGRSEEHTSELPSLMRI